MQGGCGIAGHWVALAGLGGAREDTGLHQLCCGVPLESSCAEAQRKLQQAGSKDGALPSLGSPKHPRLVTVSWDSSADGQHLGETPQSCCKLLYTSCPPHTMHVYPKKVPLSHPGAWAGLLNDWL